MVIIYELLSRRIMWDDLTVAENAARTKRMNFLFELDNRSDPLHPHSNTFSGLGSEIAIYEKWQKLLKDHE